MASGGYRSNSGPVKGTKYRKKGAVKEPKPKKGKGIPEDIVTEAAAENMTPLAYMLKVMRDDKADNARRDRMAIAASPFFHPRKGEGEGKKEEKTDKAAAAAKGKFKAGRSPLALVK